jgi:hypothetical protein
MILFVSQTTMVGYRHQIFREQLLANRVNEGALDGTRSHD